MSSFDATIIWRTEAFALTGDGHLGKTYNVVGPNVLRGDKVVSIWSDLLGKQIHYAGHYMDAFEEEMHKMAPSWSAFDIRMMFQGYLERGFTAEKRDIATLTNLLRHPPRGMKTSPNKPFQHGRLQTTLNIQIERKDDEIMA